MRDFPEGFNFDFGKPAVVGAKLFGGDDAEVNNAPPDEGAPVVDPDDDLLAGFQIGDSDPRVKGEFFVGGRHVCSTVTLAIGRETSNPAPAIP